MQCYIITQIFCQVLWNSANDLSFKPVLLLRTPGPCAMSPERWTRRTPPRASPVAASPRPDAAALGGSEGPGRGGRAAAEVRRLRGGGG